MIKQFKFGFFKLKGIQIFILVFVLALFSSCQKDNGVDANNEQDELLIRLKSKIASVQFDQLKSSVIDYVPRLDKYSIYAKEISDSVNVIFNVSEKYQEIGKVKNVDRKVFLSSLPKPECFKNPMIDFEKSIVKIIVQSLKDKNNSESLQLLNTIEDFIFNDICNQVQQNKFLYIIASFRQSYYNNVEYSIIANDNIKLKSAEVYERSCWNKCMNDKWDSYEVIDWVEFYCAPAEVFLWNSAKCAWDCAF